MSEHVEPASDEAIAAIEEVAQKNVGGPPPRVVVLALIARIRKGEADFRVALQRERADVAHLLAQVERMQHVVVAAEEYSGFPCEAQLRVLDEAVASWAKIKDGGSKYA